MSLECERHHGKVPVAEPLIDCLLPFVSQAGKGGEAVVAGRLQGEVHVLERERQSELGGKVVLGDPLQLGRLPSRHERAAGEGFHDLSVSSPNRRARATDEAAASAVNASQVLFTSFSRDPAPTGPTQMVRWPSASKRG